MFKTKKVKALEEQIEKLKSENIKQKEEIEKLKKILQGDRVHGRHCEHCVNGMKIEYRSICGRGVDYACKLNIKCNGFKEVEK